MTERELTALMAAVIHSGRAFDTEAIVQDSVSEAENLLREIDARDTVPPATPTKEQLPF